MVGHCNLGNLCLVTSVSLLTVIAVDILPLHRNVMCVCVVAPPIIPNLS